MAMSKTARCGASALAICVAAACTTSSWARDRAIANPPVLQPTRESPANSMAMPAGLEGAAPTQPYLDLRIVMTDGKIYNPATDRDEPVRLRSYIGKGIDANTPFISPMIETHPGETVRVRLENDLPAEPGCATGHAVNVPHCFNSTNLHAHGLWINPAGNGDNVLLSIDPGVSFEYEYNIQPDHPAGTFWYHTHRHGSTALQVSSGMAGALIIRGDRQPKANANGDLDVLLKGMPERILVMQQIQYACMKPAGGGAPGLTPKLNADKTYRCDPGDTGVIDQYDGIFGPGEWAKSGRYTSLNGVVLPTFHSLAGQVERWRMIHAGVRDTIFLQFARVRSNTQIPARLTAAAAGKVLKDVCSQDFITYHLVAADGLSMAAAQQTRLAAFQPGYRFDALIAFPAPGTYCIIDQYSPGAGSIGGEDIGPKLLGYVEVGAGETVADPGQHLTDTLVASAQAYIDQPVRDAVIADLRGGLRLSRFTPHPDIAESEVTGHQELTFLISNGPVFAVGNTLNSADAKPYDPARVDRALTLGSVDEWTLQSHFVSHPFHIHVNPFQIVSITDPSGKDVSAPGAVDDPNGKVDPQYAGLRGMWKDTLWIKSLIGFGPLPPGSSGIYTIRIRTRYQRYVGEFVLHCHILDHEDQGMMQNVAVVLPGSAEAAAPGGSHDH